MVMISSTVRLDDIVLLRSYPAACSSSNVLPHASKGIADTFGVKYCRRRQASPVRVWARDRAKRSGHEAGASTGA